MPKTAPEAPTRSYATITYTDGRVEQIETATPRLVYDTNRLGVISDEIDAGFFMLWLASGKPGLVGELTVENARPAVEAWLDGVKAVDLNEADMSGPPTTPRGRSRG